MSYYISSARIGHFFLIFSNSSPQHFYIISYNNRMCNKFNAYLEHRFLYFSSKAVSFSLELWISVGKQLVILIASFLVLCDFLNHTTLYSISIKHKVLSIAWTAHLFYLFIGCGFTFCPTKCTISSSIEDVSCKNSLLLCCV